MRVGLGSITCQWASPDTRSDGERYRDAVELAVEAERLGFDSVWLSEHHFFDDGYLPSCLVMAGAIAARTSRIGIGTDVLLGTLHEPVRLAEDAAVVDLLSDGRLLLGLAQGWREEEFDGLRVPFRGRHRRLEDTVLVLRQAWGDGLVTGGETVPYPGVSVTPKPARPGGPPVLIGADSEPAVRRAGRIADGFLGNWSSPDGFSRRAAWVLDELDRAGRDPASFTFAVVIPAFVSTDPRDWERVREPYWHYTWKYEDYADARGRLGPPPATPPLAAEREERLRRRLIFGSPDEVAERLLAYQAVVPSELLLIAELAWPALDARLRDEAIARFADEVAPCLRAS